MAARRRAPWSDIQPELLGLVLRRLPSLADRVRLRAVCVQWRHYARLEPKLPPTLPWLTLRDGTFLSISGGEIHRVPLPEDVRGCHGSVGNWLFIEHTSGWCSLTNPFTGDDVQLAKVSTIWLQEKARTYPVHCKLVMLSSSLDPSSDFVFVALLMDNLCDSVISICSPPKAAAFRPDADRVLDIAFFGGKVYALSHRRLLEIDYSVYGGEPSIPSMKCVLEFVNDSETTYRSFVSNGYSCLYWRYLVESRGRLLHIRRLVVVLSTVPDDKKVRHARTVSFDIFEADLTNNPCGPWRRVNTLGDQALFVGTHSKSLPARECGAQEDCIYFMRDYDQGNDYANPFADCGVFNMRNGEIMPLPIETATVWPQSKVGRPAWYFPTETL